MLGERILRSFHIVLHLLVTLTPHVLIPFFQDYIWTGSDLLEDTSFQNRLRLVPSFANSLSTTPFVAVVVDLVRRFELWGSSVPLVDRRLEVHMVITDWTDWRFFQDTLVK